MEGLEVASAKTLRIIVGGFPMMARKSSWASANATEIASGEDIVVMASKRCNRALVVD